MPIIAEFWPALRHAVRRLTTQWRPMLTAVLSLAAAMTATVVGLGVFNAVMLRPPGVAAPDEVLTMFVRTPTEAFDSVSFEDYKYYRDHNHAFAGLAAFPQTITSLTLTETLAALPGVESVSLADGVPVGLAGYGRDRVRGEREPQRPGDRGAETSYSVVDDRYFATLGIPLRHGRTFDARDTPKAPEVIVINETMARAHWPNEDPIGQRIQIENGHRFAQVIGVVADGKYNDLDEAQLPFMYFALSQHYLPDVSVIARTSGRVSAWIVPLTKAIAGLDPNLAFGLRTFDDHMHVALLVPVLILTVSGLGALALVLAVVGLYSTVFYSVSQRRNEIGIRVALGAQPRDLFRLVLRHTALLTCIGVVIDVVLSMLALPIVASLFYGIRPVESFIILSVITLTLTIASLTAYIAAKPWTRMSALDMVRRA